LKGKAGTRGGSNIRTLVCDKKTNFKTRRSVGIYGRPNYKVVEFNSKGKQSELVGKSSKRGFLDGKNKSLSQKTYLTGERKLRENTVPRP